MNRGFSFIEMTIYSALLGGILSLVLLSVYPLFRSIEIQNAHTAEDMEALFIMQKIAHLASGLRTVDTPLPGATSTSLHVHTFSNEEHSLVYSDSSLLLDNGNGTPLPLNAPRVAVTDFMVSQRAENASSSALLEITFTLNATSYGPVILSLP